MKFNTLPLSQEIFRAIDDMGYQSLTPIQQQSIPFILDNKDFVGCAQTGTGKTAAFSIPLLQLIQKGKKTNAIQALILTPTRELAIQIEQNIKQYAKYLPIKSVCIFGGVSQNKQENALRKGANILIATPGRLLDLVNQKIINLSRLEYFILDEADRMLDMGFVHDVKKILKIIPKKRQTLFFSATMPDAIKKLASTMLTTPEHVNVTPVSSTAKTVGQTVHFVEKADKTSLLVTLLKQHADTRSLVFTRTKHGADKLVRKLQKSGLTAAAIHGNKSQNARQRALNEFKSEKIKILIATDIAARGIDIEELPLVINYELPNVPETYVHRIGRTGRAGASGKAISFCSTEEQKDLKNIQKLIGKKIPVTN